MKITPELLVAAVGCSRARAEAVAPFLDEACAAYDIARPARLAAFLAQVGHESGSFRYVEEIADGAAYEGRADLGNMRPGDGRRYKGRGFIQTTGRYNHAAVRDRLRTRLHDVPDFEATPEALTETKWAAWSAADYWGWKGLNALADSDQFEQITRRINGGLNGQADRLKRWERAKAAIAAAVAATPIEETVVSVTPPAAPAPIEPATTQEAAMPAQLLLSPFIAAAASAIADAVPKLGELFAGEGPTAKRNVEAASIAVSVVKDALGAKNEQEIVEQLQTGGPEVVAAVKSAIETGWFQITEAGGGGIAGAREADQKRLDATDKIRDVFKSHSFWVAIGLLPLVYLIVGSLIGVVGTATWSDDVRAGLSGSIVSAIIGGLVGYYYGQTTSRNRS